MEQEELNGWLKVRQSNDTAEASDCVYLFLIEPMNQPKEAVPPTNLASARSILTRSVSEEASGDVAEDVITTEGDGYFFKPQSSFASILPTL